MKQLTKAMLLSGMLGLGALAGIAEEKNAVKFIPTDFNNLRSNAYVSGKTENIKNGRIVYEVKGKDIPTSCLLVRGTDDGKLRLDIITAEDVFSACSNGKKYWGYAKESGQVDLSQADITEMKLDTPFYPFPFLKDSFYKTLTPAGVAVFRTSMCHCYDALPAEGDNFKLNLWIDDETGKLCMVTSQSDEGVYSTSFRNYRDFGGVELPTRLNLSDPEGVIIMTLRYAEWNVEFAPGIFDEYTDIAKDPRLAELQKYLATKDVKKAQFLEKKAQEEAAQAAADKAKADKAQAAVEKREAGRDEAKYKKQVAAMQKEIADLTLQIDEKTQELNLLGAYIDKNVEGVVGAIDEGIKNPYIYRHTWTRRGWGHSHSTLKLKKNKKARRTAKKLYKEAEKASKDYDKLSHDINLLQLQRSEVQAALDKLLSEK